MYPAKGSDSAPYPPPPALGAFWRKPGRSAATGVFRRLHQGVPDVVADGDREEHGVDPVEHAAVGAQSRPGVLRPDVALDERLEEVTHRRGHGNAEAEDQRVRAREPVL